VPGPGDIADRWSAGAAGSGATHPAGTAASAAAAAAARHAFAVLRFPFGAIASGSGYEAGASLDDRASPGWFIDFPVLAMAAEGRIGPGSTRSYTPGS